MSSQPSALLLEEYKSCRQLLADDIKWMDQLEIYTVGAVAAVYVFMFTLKANEFTTWVALVPPTICMAAALRTVAIDRTIRVINDYLENIEKLHPEIGYTTFYRKTRSPTMRHSRQYVWTLLIAATCGGYIYVRVKGPFWL
ncbi:hypothetical protein ACTZWT_01050 [Rhodopseudomonas sp. NSM]|uniref:hypothetical protein n=1 Tax=Rhodopseudomonas sp. NSM TaxID=3457630 RepID=UPI0040374FF1